MAAGFERWTAEIGEGLRSFRPAGSSRPASTRMTSPSPCSPRSREGFSSLRYNGAPARSKLRSIPSSPLPSADGPRPIRQLIMTGTWAGEVSAGVAVRGPCRRTPCSSSSGSLGTRHQPGYTPAIWPTFFDAVERAQLGDLLDVLGPQAPTLLEPWTARDLAAHLILRERDSLAGPGLVLPGGWSRLAERRRRALALQGLHMARCDAPVGTAARLLPYRMGAPAPEPQ